MSKPLNTLHCHLPPLAADPTTSAGKVAALSDGDTITVLHATITKQKVRPTGIDAPEKAQVFGTKAREALVALVFGKGVTVTVVDKDRYGRWVGKVRPGDTDVNTNMVRDGYAWRYVTYDKAGDYSAAEAEARKAKRGLWADKDPLPPWEFRKMK